MACQDAVAMANVDDVDQALEFENEGGFLADDFDDDDLLAAAVRAEQELGKMGKSSAALVRVWKGFQILEMVK